MDTVELPHRDRAVLIRGDGPTAGMVYSLRSGALRVGRGPCSGLYIDDLGVSRDHALISQASGRYTIEDLGSCNGTFVCGKQVRKHPIADGEVIHFGPTATFRFALMDTQEEEALQRLYQSSIHDPLTSVYNRRHLAERLQSELSFAQRHHTLLSAVLFDIDHFKRVNDTYGHSAGDAVLRRVATVASEQLRTEDLLARFGGEEFVVLLRDTDLLGAAVVAERIRHAVSAKPIATQNYEVPVTISAGCASLDCIPKATSQHLIDAADRRLYRAKHGGRNQVVVKD